MGDNYKKVQAGDPLKFPAPVYNKLIDLVQGGPRTGAGDAIRAHRSSGILDVHNNSTIDLDVGQILGIGGPLWTLDENEDDFQYDPSLTGVEPSVDYDTGGKFAVAIEPVPQDTIAPMAVSGVVPVRVYVNSADDKFCDVVAKETVDEEDCYLGTGGSGAQILWLEDEAEAETIAWAIVRLGGASPSSSFYQLLTDLDDDDYEARAKVGSYSADGVLYVAEDAEEVIVVDPSQQIPAWSGDWMECEPITLNEYSDPKEFKDEPYNLDITVKIVARCSQQLGFYGVLLGQCGPGGSTGAVVIINQQCSKTVYDVGFITPGNLLPVNTIIEARYYPNLRAFGIIPPPCLVCS